VKKSINQIVQEDGNTSANEAARIRDREAGCPSREASE
jgi:hypothetical protein